jgi:hypothetical protein
MNITLPDDLVSVLEKEAAARGVTPEIHAINVLRRQLIPGTPPIPKDEWERKLFEIGIDCGVSVPDWALSSDGIYD